MAKQKETKKNDELAVPAKNLITMTQDDIPAMLDKVNAQIAAFRKGLPKENKTTGNLTGFGPIAQINNLSHLIQAYTMVSSKEAAFKETCSIPGLIPEGIKAPVFKIDGSTPSAWLDDIRGKIVEVAHKTQLDKLTKIKTTLESNLSQKAKLAKDLLEINQMLVGDEDVSDE